MKKYKIQTMFLTVFLLSLFLKSEILGIRNDEVVSANKSISEVKLYSINSDSNNIEDTDIRFMYENKLIKFNSSIKIINNRYYLPLNNINNIIKGIVKIRDNHISINCENEIITIDSSNKVVSYKSGKTDSLRNDIGEFGLVKYISLYDFCKIFNLKTTWNHNEKIIGLYKNRESISQTSQKNVGRVAFIRFEDVEAGGAYLDDANLEKFRVIGDYLYSRSIPFHIAWIPRYVNPPKGIDNNLLENNNIADADFIFTLDYLIDKGGVIGLHGYTHQNGNEESVIGAEFTNKVNTDEKSIRERVEGAISTASKLNIPITFFESPHYLATQYQQSIFEKYFDYIYEPYIDKYNKIPMLSPRNHKTLYIPTPLGYINNDASVEKMIKNIDSNNINQLASLFYHPTKELDAIGISECGDGYHKYYYDSNSILHQIVNALESNGYRIISIKDYK